MDWVAYKHQRLISHSFGVREFKIQALAASVSDEDLLLGNKQLFFFSVSLHGGRGKLSDISFLRALPLFMREGSAYLP